MPNNGTNNEFMMLLFDGANFICSKNRGILFGMGQNNKSLPFQTHRFNMPGLSSSVHIDGLIFTSYLH